MKHIVVALFILINIIYASENTKGTLSIFVLKDGVPLSKNEVLIDKKYTYYTDDDGAVKINTFTGKHLVEIFAKMPNGKNLSYGKKNIEVKAKRDTQVMLTVTSNNRLEKIDTDVPVGKMFEEHKVNTIKGTGTLSGRVLSSQGKQPVGGARIFVRGTSVDARTDADGRFSVSVPAGIPLAISVVHSAYSSSTIGGIKVKPNMTTSKTIVLTPASMELEEFVVLAPKVEGSIASVMIEEKKANAIVNVLGSEELSKKGDSDAASALKRVTGVTLVGSSVYIRGLGDRYGNVELNSLPLPSPNPIKRMVPLDIFPSGVIESLKVQKSATADIPASFGGGYIDIRTKEDAKDNYIKISLQAKQNSYTGKLVDTYQGSDSDWTGKDDGYRAVPQDILDASAIKVGEQVTSFDTAYGYTQEQLDNFMKNIVNRELSTKKDNLPYGGKISIEGAYKYEINDDQYLSFFVNYSYNQDNTYREEDYFSYAYNQAEDKLYTDPEQFGKVYRTIESYQNSFIFNTSYHYADIFKLKFTKLYTLNSESVTKIADGIANSDDDWKIRYDLNWEERELDLNQISGNLIYQIYNTANEFRFGFEQGTASLNQPGNYKYAYLRDIRFDGVIIGDPYLDRFSPNAVLNMTSNDDIDAFYLKNKIKLNFFTKDDYLDIGISSSTKTRKSRYNKYLINQASGGPKLTDDIDSIYDDNVRNSNTGLFTVNTAFQPAYWYDADVEQKDIYLNMFLKPLENLEMMIGVRSVDYSQILYEYTNNNNILQPIEKVSTSLKFQDYLPSFNAKYKINDSNHLDIAISKTFIVPDLREFSSGEFFHPYEVATVKGNPNLVETNIQNYDLKYSHYFSDTENIKFGLFYKYLDKPIEDIVLRSSSLPRYGFDNADFAKMYGFEIDGRKSFDFIHSMLNNFYLSGNFTYNKSEVTLRKEQEELLTTNKRPLQGLSETVLNLALSYETKDRSITCAYNKMGERIRKLGTIDASDEYPDIYEAPPALLDFVWIEKYENGLSWKVKLGNLLDEETIWYQGSEENIVNRFKTGRTYSLELSYKY